MQCPKLAPTLTRGAAQRRLRSTIAASGSSAPPQGNGKHVFLTGGNTGIGYECAKDLLSQGYAVTIACRDAGRMGAAAERLKQEVPGARPVSTLALDLGDMASVRDCAKRVADSGTHYEVWLNNAGVMFTPQMKTTDGFEFQVGINHLGHFALTQAVLPALQASGKPVRLINVASSAHMFGTMDFDDLMSDKAYDSWKQYGRSKLANVMYSYELARRLGGQSPITVNALHPGVVKTELGRYMIGDNSAWYMPAAVAVMGLFMKTPEQGAQTSLHLATSQQAEGLSGKYWSESKPISSSAISYDTAVAAKLWQMSEELTAVKQRAMV